jgi:guanylate cyclase
MNRLQNSFVHFSKRVLRIGEDPGDSEAVRLEKRLVVAASLLIILAAAFWGTFYFLFGSQLAGAISLVYSVISALLLGVVGLIRRHRFYIFYQLLMGMLIPSIHSILLGGFASSSAVILWSLMSPLGAQFFFPARQAVYWCAIYLAVLVVQGLLQPVILAQNNLPNHLIQWVFVLNVVLISSIVFLMLSYFINQKNTAYRLLHVEQEKADRLLLNILPREIAAILKNENRVIADGFEGASILFADLVGFTPLTAQMVPVEMVNLLNGIFSFFDSLVEKYDLEKIRTIGDNYMVASGVPRLRSDHAQVLACMALEMRAFIAKHPPVGGKTLQFRIGINSGPVIGGVIGRKKFVYDLWGDAVNIASRMESQGEAGKIQITQATYDLIKSQFICEPRGTIVVKGRGEMATWFLVDQKTT